MTVAPIHLRCLSAIIASCAVLLATTAFAAEKEHPLKRELESARKRVEQIEANVKDYTCKFTKRERVDGELLEYEVMFARVRHEPFSVYLYFMAPEARKGQQAVYVEGKHDNKLLALPVGLPGKLGVYTLDPTGYFAMQGQRYPITETGFLNLAQKLIEVGETELENRGTQVKTYKGAKVDGRSCSMIEVINPTRGSKIPYHKARIFVDDEYDIPVRFESYDWPAEEGGEPQLLEEYTYTDIKLNQDLTDDDFTIRQ